MSAAERAAFVAATHAEVRRRWPSLGFDPPRFEAACEERRVSPTVHGAELFLAWRCAEGDAAAIRILDEEYLLKIPERVRRIDGSDTFGAEVTQRIRERLLVAREGRARIGDFAGRGSLLSWVQVAAARVALNLRRDERVGLTVSVDEVELVAETTDPALQLIKQRHREDFRDAFCEAVAALAAGERELLRLHFVDGLSLAQIGRLQQLDKSNVSRRLSLIRHRLFTDTRRRIEQRLGLATAEFESLMKLVQSQLHLSIERILK
jgi:RNA polymerase sigma-70 factor (ECF subfamily)